MGVTVLFYKLFQFKADLAAIFVTLLLPWKRNLQIYNQYSKTLDMFLNSNQLTQLLQTIIIVQICYLNYVFFILLKSVGSHLKYCNAFGTTVFEGGDVEVNPRNYLNVKQDVGSNVTYWGYPYWDQDNHAS